MHTNDNIMYIPHLMIHYTPSRQSITSYAPPPAVMSSGYPQPPPYGEQPHKYSHPPPTYTMAPPPTNAGNSAGFLPQQ